MVKELPDRVMEKAFKDPPNLPIKAVRKKPSRPTLIKVPQKQGTGPSTGYQHKPSLPHQTQHSKGFSSHPKKEAPALSGSSQTQHRPSHQGHSSFPKTDRVAENQGTSITGTSDKRRTPTSEDGTEDVPGGRLQLFQEAWIDAPASTRVIMKRGFHWEWISNPPALSMPKLRAGAPELGEEVSKLLQKRAIYKVPLQPCSATMTNHNTLRDLITEAAWELLWTSRMLTFTSQSGKTYTSSWPSPMAANFISSRFSPSVSM